MDSAARSLSGLLARSAESYPSIAWRWLQNGRCDMAAERMGDRALTFP
jgi:hypothetical protein